MTLRGRGRGRDILRLIPPLFILLLCSTEIESCPRGCKCNETVVDCNYSNLTSVPNLETVNIETLLLSGNRIKGLGQELQAYQNLQHLDLSINNITTISDGAFQGLEKLEQLILRRNFLVSLADKTFQGLQNLTDLDLSYNMLKTVSDGVFSELTSLTQLDLKRNNISSIQDDAFNDLKSLKTFNLAQNLIQEFPTAALSRVTSLQKLVLDDNELDTLPQYALSGLVNLEIFSLNGNHLETIDPLTFSGVSPPLKELSLKGADLDEVPIEAFRNLTTLEILDISKNNFSSIRRGSFSELLNLRKLVITSSEYLKTIENGSFAFMFKLEEIVITNNKALTLIGQAAFPSAPTLRYVDLSSNSITTFFPSIVDWDIDVVVDLRDNPLLCDCNIIWMISTLANAANSNTRSFAKNLTCSAPASYSGTSVLSLPASNFQCSGNKKTLAHEALGRTKVAAIAAGITSFVLVTVALLIKFRNKICLLVGRQYRYRHYKNNNGVFTVNGQNGDLQEEGTQMDVISSHTYKDDPDIQDND